MDEKTLIARRVARELKDGMLVNLGIGLPTLVAHNLPAGVHVLFQSENGIIGMDSLSEEGLASGDLTDAGCRPTGAIPGACAFDSAMSFGLIRGGHIDASVLGGLEVDESGHLANWMVPGKMIPGMGGAMDLVTGSKLVIVAMVHAAKGISKIVPRCTLPLTSCRRIDLVVTDLAVLKPTDSGLVLHEVAPGVSVEQVIAATAAKLTIPAEIPVMEI